MNVRSRLKIERDVGLRGETPIIVYQMGKVASTAVTRSLSQQCKLPVFQVHRMTDEYIDGVRKEHGKSRLYPMLPSDYLGQLLYRRIVKTNLPAYVISLIRDPVARNISAYFQNRIEMTGVPASELGLDVEELTQDFLDTYPHDVPLTWFDREMKRTIGVDVYRYPFDPDQGFQVINKGPFDIILLRTDLPDERKAAALADFLAIDDLTIERTHESDDKAYAKPYRLFKSNTELPDSYLDQMYSSRLADHFFTERETERLRAEWSGTAVSLTGSVEQ